MKLILMLIMLINADNANNGNFRSFKYNTKLLRNKAVQPAPNAANGILKNATIALPVK